MGRCRGLGGRCRRLVKCLLPFCLLRSVVFVRVRQPPLLSQGRVGGYGLRDRFIYSSVWEEVSSPDIAVFKHAADVGGLAVKENMVSAILPCPGERIEVHHKGIGQGFCEGMGQCLYGIF